MNIHQDKLEITTSGRGVVNITDKINKIVVTSSIKKGLCNIFLQHTSASLILCENYDPQVQIDLEAFFKRLIPDGDPLFKHDAEGEDDMPAHIRTVLTQNSLSIPIGESKMQLGTWQGVFLWEHRYASHQRKITLTILGE